MSSNASPAIAPAPAESGRQGRIVRKTTTELVLDALRDRIFSGQLPPGTPLRQELLADELGVSRIPVREALRLLSAEGLVDAIPHRGAFVSMLSKAEVEELFDIRMRLEPWLFRDVVAGITEGELQQAERIIEQMSTADPSLWGRLNWQLHETLYQAAQRPVTVGILRTLHEKSERYFRFQVVNAPIREQARQEHMALVAFCRERDVEQAVAALETHIEQAAVQILAIVERLLDHAPSR